LDTDVFPKQCLGGNCTVQSPLRRIVNTTLRICGIPYRREYDFTLLRPAARRRLWQPGHTRGEPHFLRLDTPCPGRLRRIC
jgi:hypothetical protein